MAAFSVTIFSNLLQRMPAYPLILADTMLRNFIILRFLEWRGTFSHLQGGAAPSATGSRLYVCLRPLLLHAQKGKGFLAST